MSAVSEMQAHGKGPTEAPAALELNGCLLSHVLVSQQEGDWVLQSTEYDVTAGAETQADAIHRFVIRTTEYASFLAKDPTPDDSRIVAMINERLAGALATYEAEVEADRHGSLLTRLIAAVARRRGPTWRLHNAALT